MASQTRAAASAKAAAVAFAGTLPATLNALKGRPGSPLVSKNGKFPDYKRCVAMGHHLLLLHCEVFGGQSPEATRVMKQLARMVDHELSDKYARQGSWTARSFEAYFFQCLSAAVAKYVSMEILAGAQRGGGRSINLERRSGEETESDSGESGEGSEEGCVSASEGSAESESGESEGSRSSDEGGEGGTIGSCSIVV